MMVARCPLCGYATDTAGRCTLQGCTNVGLDPAQWVYPPSPSLADYGPGGRVKVPQRWVCSQGAWHCECYDEVEVCKTRELAERGRAVRLEMEVATLRTLLRQALDEGMDEPEDGAWRRAATAALEGR